MNLRFLDKLGSVGALIAAIACPACFPIFAAVSSVLGLSFLIPYEGLTMWALQLLVLVALAGNIIAYLTHFKLWLLCLGVLFPGLVFYAFYISFAYSTVYVALFGLMVVAILNTVFTRRCNLRDANE